MFSTALKHLIAQEVQDLLRATYHPELPEGEINFLLHVDGKVYDAWTNIRNNGAAGKLVPEELIRNMSK